MRRSRAFVVVLALAVAIAACGDDDGTAASGSSALTGTLTVLAAASLTDAFEALGEQFEAAHRGTDVEFSFAASSELAAQVREGAPADVFASADEANVQKVVDAGDADGDPVVFARNRLAIAVEAANPEGITGLGDLADPGLVVVLCASEVPCGTYADEALANAGVTVTPKSRGESVKATLSLVELGEADAAIVYATDVAASGKVEAVAIPEDENVVATLPIVRLAASDHPELADAWIDFVTSDAAARVLVDDHGFLAP
jgi:molybdate transport system substrate-binding protein